MPSDVVVTSTSSTDLIACLKAEANENRTESSGLYMQPQSTTNVATLRHCVIQMQLQNYDLDHAIFINFLDSESDHSSARDFFPIIEDLKLRNNNIIYLDYGITSNMHENYLRSISLSDVENYDLFLKIDDDDIYRSGYVRDVVDSFLSIGWD